MSPSLGARPGPLAASPSEGKAPAAKKDCKLCNGNLVKVAERSQVSQRPHGFRCTPLKVLLSSAVYIMSERIENED